MRTLVLTFWIAVSTTLFAQEHKHEESDSLSKKSIKTLWEDGETIIHLRNYNMFTDPLGNFQSSWASAFGGQVHFHSGSWHGLSMGVGGSFILRVASSDLTSQDPLTGRIPRFERQLLDVQNPYNHDIDGLEDLYLQYDSKIGSVKFGRFCLNTPLVNPHDGRMRPNALGGAWMEFNEFKKLSVSTGFFFESSPRSTTVWVPAEETIGMFGTGFNADGSKSGYRNNLETAGMGILDINYQIQPNLGVKFWDYYIDNIVNTAMLQAEWERKSTTLGLQFIHQDGVGNGGNEDVNKAYVSEDHQSDVLAIRIEQRTSRFEFQFNYAHAFDNGRFVFPREFGYDRIYTNISRFRLEGMGNTDMISVGAKWNMKHHFSYQNQVAFLVHNNTDRFEFNKYNLPQSGQLNTILKYDFIGTLDGLKLKFMHVWNFPLQNINGRPDMEYNLANFQQFNLILNYELSINKHH